MATTDKTDKSDKLKPIYSDGETVLCFHGPVLYEAKCMKSELRNKAFHYYIHYSGWNKNWDEWVPSSRVLKCNEENKKKQEELLATHGTSKIMSKIKSNSRRSQMANIGDTDRTSTDNDKTSLEMSSFSNTSDLKKNKRQKLDESSENDESYQTRSTIVITMSDELRQILLDDYQNVCNGKLVTLPSTQNIEQLLSNYANYKLEMKFDKNVINEVVEGLKVYFNVVLPTKLLYKSERIQYTELVKNTSKKPIEVYGNIHFLRLFVKIGELLSYTFWDELCTKQLILNIEDVLKYLNDNRSTLFSSKAIAYA